MAEAVLKPESEKRLQALFEALESGTLRQVRRLLHVLHPAEIANLLESLPPAQRELVWELVQEAEGGEILAHLGDDVRNSLIDDMEAAEIVAATEGLDVDDMADILQNLPDQVIQQILQTLNNQDRIRLEKGLVIEGRKTAPCRVKGEGTRRAEIDLMEGRKRQIRLMFERLGYRVRKLERTEMGRLSLRGLSRGEVRPLLPKEVQGLRRSVGL